MLLEVCFICVHHTVEPREQLLGAVICMEDDWDTIGWGDRTDVVGGSDCACDGSGLVLVFDALVCVSAERASSVDQKQFTLPAK